MRRAIWIIFLGFSFSIFSLGQSWGQSTPPKKTPDLLTQGKKLYEQNCMTCHGPKGDGKGPAGVLLKPPPRNFDRPLDQWTYSKGDLKKVFDVISKGVPNTGMVAWSHLSEQNRWALVYYVTGFASPLTKKK